MAYEINEDCLRINEPAAHFHEDGLQRELAGRYTEAHLAFERALGSLDRLPEAEQDSLDVEVQRARIVRDDGFTNVREALTGPERDRAEAFDDAHSILLESSALTEAVAVAAQGRIQSGQEVTGRIREAMTEHGATRACLGRQVLAMQVATGELSTERKATPEVVAAQKYFGRDDAHGFLRVGSNQYYRTSNAMRGALAERANGRPTHAVPWLGRAAVGLAKSVATREFRPAAQTVLRIGFALRTRRAALASIVERP